MIFADLQEQQLPVERQLSQDGCWQAHRNTAPKGRKDYRQAVLLSVDAFSVMSQLQYHYRKKSSALAGPAKESEREGQKGSRARPLAPKGPDCVKKCLAIAGKEGFAYLCKNLYNFITQK